MARYDLYTADEVFLTGTAAEVVPAGRRNTTSASSARAGPGPITRRLIDDFRKLVQTTGTPIYERAFVS